MQAEAIDLRSNGVVCSPPIGAQTVEARSRLRCWGRPLAVLLLLFTGVADLFADGTQTGVLAGTVKDARGELLQGVPVELSGPQGNRNGYTDEEGRFRFLALGVGSYDVSAELLGLTARAGEVAIYVNRTTNVELVLKEEQEAATESSVEDWIQVIAEAPLVDRFETRLSTNVRLEFLDELPVQRFYQSVALLLPGVSGGADGNPQTSGALRSSNLYLVDGVDTTDPTTGLFGLNLTYEAVQEVQVTTAAPTSDYGRSSGAVVNVVTRSGTNRYSGNARWVNTNNAWNSDFDGSAPELRHLGRDIDAANAAPDELDSTLALSLGGPLWKDRLWFFSAFEDASSSFSRPTLEGTLWDGGADVESSAFKVTAQATPQHTLVAQHTADDASFAAFDPFARDPSELALPEVPVTLEDENEVNPTPGEIFALEAIGQEGRFSKLEWNAVLGRDYSLVLTLAEQEREIDRGSLNSRGLTGDAAHVGVVIDPRDEQERFNFFLFNGATEVGFERRPRQQGNLALDAFVSTGAIEHEIKAGVDYQETESESQLNAPGVAGLDPATGLEVAGQLFIDFDLRPECLVLGQCMPFNPNTGEFQAFSLFNMWARPRQQTREETTAVHFSDTMIFDRWLLSLGVRWESVRGEDENGRRLVDDSDFAPRIGVNWDPIGDGKMILSATWGRYHEPFLQQYLDAFARLEPLTGFTEYERLEFAGGRDCRTVAPGIIDSPCWRPIGVMPFIQALFGDPDPDLERSSVEEFMVGFERQLTTNTAITLHWIDRRWRDLWDDVLTLVPDPSGEPAVAAEVLNLPEAERQYRGLHLLFQKRFADNWQMLASYTWSEAEGNLFSANGLDDFADFRDFVDTNLVNRFGLAPYDRTHQLGVFGNYQIPFERLLISLGSALRYTDGVPYQAERFEEAGRRFLTPRGSERLPGVLQLDLAANFDVRLASELELELKAEIFNLTDEQEALAAESLLDTGLFGRPRTINALQRPRSYRFSIGLRF